MNAKNFNQDLNDKYAINVKRLIRRLPNLDGIEVVRPGKPSLNKAATDYYEDRLREGLKERVAKEFTEYFIEGQATEALEEMRRSGENILLHFDNGKLVCSTEQSPDLYVSIRLYD